MLCVAIKRSDPFQLFQNRIYTSLETDPFFMKSGVLFFQPIVLELQLAHDIN